MYVYVHICMHVYVCVYLRAKGLLIFCHIIENTVMDAISQRASHQFIEIYFLLIFYFATFFQYFTISAFHFLFSFELVFVSIVFAVVFWNCFAHLPVHQAYIYVSSAQLYAHSYLYARKWWLRHQWQLAFHSKSYHTAFQFRSPFVGYCYVCHTFCCTLIYVYTCGCCCPTGYRLYRQIRVYTKVYTIYYILHTCRHTYVCICVYDVCLLRFDHLGALLTNRWVDLLVFRCV